MKAVLEYARAKGLRGAGGLIRCDVPMEALLGCALLCFFVHFLRVVVPIVC
jgi:hypothetical protein